jgi:3-oxoacyl-[acyl-carrier protein] reductase
MVPVGRAAKPLLSGRVPTADGNPDFDLSTGQEPESYSVMNPYRAITEGNEETAMGKLDGKVAIVTGAARGLGRAYAKRLAGLGAKIAVTDLNQRSYGEFESEANDMTGDSTVTEIEAAGGIALGIEVDVRDREAVEAMVAQVVQEWGRIDVLVANAGGGRGRPIDTKASTLDLALLQLVVEMNLFGTVYSCNAVAPIMKGQRSGKIITVSSVAGTAPCADGGYAHYGAAKAAIAHYTRYLAQDLGPFGIMVKCIAPGVIATGRIMATIIPGSIQSNRDRAELVALRRLGTVEDCAKVVEFLATDLSDYVTGAVIPIDGGLVRG